MRDGPLPVDVPLLADLRAPPIKGRAYMVPVVRAIYHRREDDWPVLGPLHSDKAFFNFVHPHYHVDARFVSAALARRLVDAAPWQAIDGMTFAEALTFVCTGWPLLPGKAKPRLAEMTCRRAGVGSPIGRLSYGTAKDKMVKMQAHYNDPAQPLRQPDGRLLCPHKKVDLSQFPPDRDGIVVCPLHGLRVQCGRPELVLT
jgi:hypothetical protein